MSVFRLLHVLPGDSWGQPELVLPQPLIQRASHPGRRRDQNRVSAAHRKPVSTSQGRITPLLRWQLAVGHSTAQRTDNLFTDPYRVLGKRWLLAPNQNRGEMEKSASEFNRVLVPNVSVQRFLSTAWYCGDVASLLYFLCMYPYFSVFDLLYLLVSIYRL